MTARTTGNLVLQPDVATKPNGVADKRGKSLKLSLAFVHQNPEWIQMVGVAECLSPTATPHSWPRNLPSRQLASNVVTFLAHLSKMVLISERR